MKGYRKYFRQKLIWFFATFVCAFLLNFFLPRLMPGDPVAAITANIVQGMNNPEGAQAVYRMYAQQFGTNLPIWDQFIKYIAPGDFGSGTANSGVYGVQDDHITVSNNYIHDVTEVGIDLQQVTGAHVTGNVVKRVVFGSGGGASPNLFLDLPNPPSIFGSGGVSPADAPKEFRASEAVYAEAWFRTIASEVWG